jgi:hypothetical protein
MRPGANDLMTRLAAADPARDIHADEAARADLWQRIVRDESPSPRAQGAYARPRAHRRTLVLVVPALLVLAAGALAAGGVIRFGAPAKTFGGFSYPRSGLGALTPGTVRLLPITAPDPAGGPPWSLRVLSTTRGVGCIQVGRLLDGKLGALGQDYAFGDDGRFHELPVNSTFNPFACAALDGKGRIFNNVTEGNQPASAWRGSGGLSEGCVPASATPAEKGSDITPAEKKRSGAKPPPICPQEDERNLYYGLLGPAGKSITYTLEGHSHTQATIGPEGAYLIVTRAPAHQLFQGANGGTEDVVPVDGPITELHYTGGATCHLTSKSWIGGKSACTPTLEVPVGYAPVAKAPMQAQVATPLHVRLVRNKAGGQEILVSFRSRFAITTDRSDYAIEVHEPNEPPQVHTGYRPTQSNIAAGQTVTTRLRGGFGPHSSLTPGLYKGTVTLIYATGPALLEGPGTAYVHVGSFTVRVP